MITPECLLTIIDYNAETKPKPFHHNKDLMTCALQMESENDREEKTTELYKLEKN